MLRLVKRVLIILRLICRPIPIYMFCCWHAFHREVDDRSETKS